MDISAGDVFFITSDSGYIAVHYHCCIRCIIWSKKGFGSRSYPASVCVCENMKSSHSSRNLSAWVSNAWSNLYELPDLELKNSLKSALSITDRRITQSWLKSAKT